MASPRKTIVSCGLGQYAKNDENARAHFGADAHAKVTQMLSDSVEKAKQAGFDVIAVDVNPQDPADTMKRFSETFENRDVAGVNFGFGIRGHKEHTELFEKLVNTAYSLRPGIRVMFSNGPDEVFPTILRNFPDDA